VFPASSFNFPNCSKYGVIVPEEELVATDEPEANSFEEEDKTFKEKTRDFFYGILGKMHSYIRVRDHGKTINAILPPSEQNYLRQNLRLMLEQAQAALLRGEGEVYQDALVKARNWINQYYELNEQSKILLDELRLLEQQNVELEYNNFENSRSALSDYIQRLQKAAVRRGVR